MRQHVLTLQLFQAGAPMTGLTGAIGYALITISAIVWLGALFWGMEATIFKWRKLTQAVPAILLTIVVLAWAGSYSPEMIRQVAGLAKPDWSKIVKEPVVNKNFINTEVVLDGKSFRHCTFTNVTLIYKGEAPFDLENNVFNGALISPESEQLRVFFMLLKELTYISDHIKFIPM